MMNYVFAGMILIAVIFGCVTGNAGAVTSAVFSGTSDAVELFITLCGVMAFWNGVMKIAEECHITDRFSRVMRPLIKLLFPKLNPESPAAGAISMNITANLLGLGNAATPFGIKAMNELNKLNSGRAAASDDMVTFVVINTASLQLIPTTIAALRASCGAKVPMDIMPSIWLASVISLAAGVTVSRILAKFTKKC